MTATRRFQAKDGAWLVYRDEGTGPPVLALAGLTRDGRDFDYLARRVSGIRLIRLDSRGRGGSEWTGSETYSVAQEAQDALSLLDYLGIARAAIIGSSRGGLLGMVMAATARHRVAGLCLNDVGPVLEREGLVRIGRYIGEKPAVDSLEQIADRMPLVMPGFGEVPELRWVEETLRHYVETAQGIDLPYDPALRQSFDAAMAKPLGDAWPLFDACKDIPLALIHGANSDVLSTATADAMQARRPDMIRVELPDRGHIPFLDEPAALAAIESWLRLCFPDGDGQPTSDGKRLPDPEA